MRSWRIDATLSSTIMKEEHHPEGLGSVGLEYVGAVENGGVGSVVVLVQAQDYSGVWR